jgi:flagellar hook-associated protein 2
VVSSIPTSTSNSSGIGTTLLDQKGVDVAGTINEEAATGIGQFLTGSQQGTTSTTNGKALGLQIRVTATAPGSYGTISFTSGVADLVKNYVNTQTDGFTGALATAVNGFQDNINDLQGSITDLETQLTAQQQALTDQYAQLEATVSQLRSAGAGLAALGLTVTSPSSNASSSASSSSSSSSSSGTPGG